MQDKKKIFRTLLILFSMPMALIACKPLDMSQLKEVPASLIKNGSTLFENDNSSAFEATAKNTAASPLEQILDGSLANKNKGNDFKSVLRYALDSDPFIISKRRELEAKLAVIDNTKAKKEFNVGATLYGGVEDITDNTKGVAVALSASRLVFDGGKADLKIDSARLMAEAAQMELIAAVDRRAYELCLIWLELDKYKTLQGQIEKRLAVLNPLIDQLEKVAKAGIGDVSKVTAAQRTVTAIRVEQTNVAEGLARAQLEFTNSFGPISADVSFDHSFISNLVPTKVDDELAQKSPLILSQYAIYQSSVARLKALKAKDGFDIGFEARAVRPFAGSGYDSDESFGLIGRKTLFNGGLLESEIREAEALVEAAAAEIRSTFREGAKSVQTAAQNIISMDKAILIARENAKLTSDEIVYLKQQLVIGGSTLDSVLSAEARLYDAESKEIQFLTEKYKSQLVIISSIGMLGSALDI